LEEAPPHASFQTPTVGQWLSPALIAGRSFELVRFRRAKRTCRDPRLSRPVLFGFAWKPIFCPDSTPLGGKSGGVVRLRMSSATRRRRAPKRPRVRRYSISSSAYALWPPLRLWPFSPARHFKDIARRLVDRRVCFNRIRRGSPPRAWRGSRDRSLQPLLHGTPPRSGSSW
jgi:hypothetical protein